MVVDDGIKQRNSMRNEEKDGDGMGRGTPQSEDHGFVPRFGEFSKRVTVADK